MGRQDCNPPEWVEHQEVMVSADDAVSAATDGELQVFIVFRVAALPNGLRDFDQLCHLEQALKESGTVLLSDIALELLTTEDVTQLPHNLGR